MKRPVLAILASGALGFAFGAFAVVSTGELQGPPAPAVCPVTGAVDAPASSEPPGAEPGRETGCPFLDGEGSGSTATPGDRCPGEAGAATAAILRV